MTLLILCMIVFVVVVLAGFAAWIGQHLDGEHGEHDLSELDCERATRPLGNVSVIEPRGKV